MSATDEFKAAQESILRHAGVEAESRFLDIDAVSGRTHVLIAGSGPPVVMVPGFGDPAAMWAPLMGRLDGFTLFAVDRPCFGLTGSATHTTSNIRSLAVTFLEQVLDALGLGRPEFVGNSIGSLWSMWLAIDRPERVAATSHIGCPAFILDTSAPLPMRLLSVPVLGRLLMRMSPPSPKQVDRFASMVGVDMFAELRDLLVAAQKLPGTQAAVLELVHSLATIRGGRPEISLQGTHLAQITQPAQLIWGERDPFGSDAAGERAAAAIPDAELHVVSGAGHAPWINAPETVGELVSSFLTRHVTRRSDR